MSKEPTCAVVVPVYRNTLSENEGVSFNRCLTVLGKHPIILVTYPELDMTAYRERAIACGVDFSVRYFNRKRFTSVHAYNGLMLAPEFYDAFQDFDYILICQLDAYVFEDRLMEWCSKRYDYIGAPIFAPGSEDIRLATVGNGGFSLRRVAAFQEAVLAKLSPFVRRKPNPYITWSKKLAYFLMLAVSGRNLRLRDYLTYWVPEDIFFSFALQGTEVEMYVPNALEATWFGLEGNARLAFAQNGKNYLPFGWHATWIDFVKNEYRF